MGYWILVLSVPLSKDPSFLLLPSFGYRILLCKHDKVAWVWITGALQYLVPLLEIGRTHD
jgi:hypothetical protein